MQIWLGECIPARLLSPAGARAPETARVPAGRGVAPVPPTALAMLREEEAGLIAAAAPSWHDGSGASPSADADVYSWRTASSFGPWPRGPWLHNRWRDLFSFVVWCDVNTPELPRVVIPQLGEWSHRLDRTPSGERHSAAVAAFFRPPSPPPSLASTRSHSASSPEYSPEYSDGEMDAPPPSPPPSPESDAAWYVRLGGDCPRPRVATERQSGDPRQGGGLRPHARWLRQPNGWRPTPAKRATTNNAKTMIT